MRQAVPINLSERAATALTATESELWLPHLTYDLTRPAWRRLKDEFNIERLGYGSARVLLKDASAVRNAAFHILFKDSEDTARDLILIEVLPKVIARHYENSGIDFYAPARGSLDEPQKSEISNCLCKAFELIKQIPSLWRTVIDLVRCIHLIRTETDEYDVSFSEPHIPFSIFISVPQVDNTINVLRVAEAIIHEAMHLQLTLIEAVVPLTFNSEEKFYSPWKDEHRSVGGVLHALYVFRILHSFFTNLLDFNSMLSVEKDYIEERRGLIAEQIIQINDFANCAGLTSLGKVFIRNLLNISLQ